MMKILTIILFSFLSHSLEEDANEGNYRKFREILHRSKNVLIITGAGISVESGLPSFLAGASRVYRNYDSRFLTNPDTFNKSPSVVWEFHNYQRELIFNTVPNKAHYAIAEYERECNLTNRNFTLITQNTDELHKKAGSQNIIELLGSLFKTRCSVCGDIQPNYDSPVCPAFRNKSINPSVKRNETEDVPVSELPRCKRTNCNGLLRPDVTWLTERLKQEVIEKTEEALERADVCLIVGTSSVVQPASDFPVKLAQKGVPVAEFHTWSTLNTKRFQFHLRGLCAETLPKALRKWEDEDNES